MFKWKFDGYLETGLFLFIDVILQLFRKLNFLLGLQQYSKLLISNFRSLSRSFFLINSSCLELETVKQHFSVFSFMFVFPKLKERLYFKLK